MPSPLIGPKVRPAQVHIPTAHTPSHPAHTPMLRHLPSPSCEARSPTHTECPPIEGMESEIDLLLGLPVAGVCVIFIHNGSELTAEACCKNPSRYRAPAFCMTVLHPSMYDPFQILYPVHIQKDSFADAPAVIKPADILMVPPWTIYQLAS